MDGCAVIETGLDMAAQRVVDDVEHRACNQGTVWVEHQRVEVRSTFFQGDLAGVGGAVFQLPGKQEQRTQVGHGRVDRGDVTVLAKLIPVFLEQCLIADRPGCRV
ncbi:hypothetical protein D3C76_1091850 [compost metagenome]